MFKSINWNSKHLYISDLELHGYLCLYDKTLMVLNIKNTLNAVSVALQRNVFWLKTQ